MGLRHEEEEWEGGKRQEVSEPTRHTENLCEGNWGEKIPFILEQRAKRKNYLNMNLFILIANEESWN